MSRFMVAGLLAAGLMAIPAESRPVIYVGGTMAMVELEADTLMIEVLYTPHRRWSLGPYALHEGSADRLGAGLALNHLAARRNTRHSQANLYILSGVGPSWVRRDGGGRETLASGWVAAEADWETRRWFVGGMARASLVGGEVEPGWRARLGMAPYLGEAGDLHTWLFAQLGLAAEPGAEVEVTPVLRLFRGSLLVEGGVSHRGRVFAALWIYL